ncbi:MAG TPA: flagellar hook-basal body complex protein FliE [Rhodocyclaceae bacterium]|nr:flagellar hook-basal body complex protein FliE [Rhodocyclaceae bacterium]
MDTRNIESMLAELKASTAVAQGKPASQAAEAGGTDFSKVLQSTLEQVNQAQQSAQKMTQDFASGQDNVNLQDVMVNLQKANISFQQMVQVRNKLVTAYNDIMNMQV